MTLPRYEGEPLVDSEDDGEDDDNYYGASPQTAIKHRSRATQRWKDEDVREEDDNGLEDSEETEGELADRIQV